MDPPSQSQSRLQSRYCITLFSPALGLRETLRQMGYTLEQDECDSSLWSFACCDWQNKPRQTELLCLLANDVFLLSTA